MEGNQQQQYSSLRSESSTNWRIKDETPRSNSQTRQYNRVNKHRHFQNTAASSTESPTRLYVGNLLYTAQPGDVEKFFAENGFEITRLSMSTDPFTGRNPSYCFIDLETEEDCGRALNELNGKEILGRPVKINVGIARKPSEQNEVELESKSNIDRKWRPEAATSGGYRPTFDRWTRKDYTGPGRAPNDEAHRIFVGGLPYLTPQSAVDLEMQKLFDGFEIQAISKIISPHPSKSSSPGNHFFLFIDMGSSEEMNRAIHEIDGKELPWGGKVRVGKARGDSKLLARNQDADTPS